VHPHVHQRHPDRQATADQFGGDRRADDLAAVENSPSTGRPGSPPGRNSPRSALRPRRCATPWLVSPR
jgi:hypothetical protein